MSVKEPASRILSEMLAVWSVREAVDLCCKDVNL